MNLVSEAELVELYIEKNMTMKQVAKELGVATSTVFNYIKKYGIKSRKTHDYPTTDKQREVWRQIGFNGKGKHLSFETRKKISEARKVKGVGHSKHRADGYVSVYYPSHPMATKDGFVMEHHLVMEKHIGRHIEKDEVVHHINGIRDDNRLENLQLMTFKEHAALHMRMRHEKGGMTY